MNNNTVIGIDLAKNVFQVATLCGSKIVSNKQYSRAKLKQFLCNTQATSVYMEACYSAHFWARFAQSCGHEVGLIPAQHVAPFRRGNKNDANDAVAIIEASQRPNLRLVRVKTLEQQDIQSLHRLRERLIRNRTAMINQTHGLLVEYGVIISKGRKAFLLGVTDALNDASLSNIIKHELQCNLSELEMIDRRVKTIEGQLTLFVEQNQVASILHTIPGIGVLNASALAAKYSDPHQFADARSLSVHLGLTPKLIASGHQKIMTGISKRGDPYLRKQLIHGARALMVHAPKRENDALCQWALRLKKRRGHNVAAVALANRLARLAWVLLSKNEPYRAKAMN